MSAVTLGIPRVIISGTGRGVGKSTIALGLAYELRRRRHSVSCVVLGPRLGQAAILKRAVGRSARCLDPRLLNTEQILISLFQAGVGADYVIIDGQDGLFDGPQVGSFDGTDAEMAALTKSPVALVVDARGYGGSVAAVEKGFSTLAGGARADGGFELAGSILNRVDRIAAEGAVSKETVDAAYFGKAFAAFGMNPPIGFMPEFDHGCTFPHSPPTQERNETLLPRQFFIDLQTQVGSNIDIQALMEKAELAPAVSIVDFSYEPMHRRCRIAVSEDSCFHLMFQDNLEWLRYYGAELVTFSPLADEGLPKKIGAVYLSGACLAEYAGELSRNRNMIEALRDFAERGGVIYAEGASTAYLSRDFKPEGATEPVPGVGLLPMSSLAERTGLHYEEAVTYEESVLGRPGLVVRGICTGEWKTKKEERMLKALKIARGGGVPVPEGFSPGAQIFATFRFLHFGSNPQFAKNLADAAEVVEPTGAK